MRLLALLAALLLLAAAPAKAPSPADPCPSGCIQFAVNVHDVGHVGESADTVLRLVSIFERHHVRGEFYLTGPMVELYLAERPDVIARLKASGMGVAYHVRAPHPLVPGFEAPLRDLDDAALAAALRDYETYRLDRATGALDRTRPGGFALARETFGAPPTTVVVPARDGRVKKAALELYRSLGAVGVVWYHEEGAPIERPIETRAGLVARPSDFSVTRWGTGGNGKGQFWWNRVDDPAFDPLAYLQARLAAWPHPRGAFVTALVHENNFPRKGAESWTRSYYTDASKDVPLPPPWDLTPPEDNTPRPASEQAAIWARYEALVAWSAANLRVVTMADVAAMPR
ncbi:MAG: hypothetical protein ACOZNI_09245 [Myxococcota bacterium]